MAEQHASPEEGKKSSKKLIIIIAVVLLLVGGGGAAYYFLMRGGAEHATEEGKDAKEDKKAGGKKAKGGEEKSADAEAEKGHEASPEAKEPVSFNLTQPMIVNFPKGLSATLIQVSLTFLMDSADSAAALKKHEPMLRNNLMMKLGAQNPDQLKTKEGKEALRGILLEETKQILSKVAEGSHVNEVFFTTFVMQ